MAAINAIKKFTVLQRYYSPGFLHFAQGHFSVNHHLKTLGHRLVELQK